LSVLDAANALKVCDTCRFVFDSPRPTIDELIAFYSRPTQYDDWIEANEVRDHLWCTRLAKLLPQASKGSLLDIGAGIGQFLHHARSHFDPVAGTEVSSSAVKAAIENYGLEIMHGQVESLVIDQCFDNITMFHVLEHVPNPSDTIAQCVELLNPGGTLFIAVPNELDTARQHVKRGLARLGVKRYFRRGKMQLPRIVLDGSIDEIHLSHFTVSTLRRLLERHGLTVIDEGLDPYSVVQGARGAMDKILRLLGEVTALNRPGFDGGSLVWISQATSG
jgi:SAM-dependent methyltransferase